ncbi:DUF642 domain-containing protein [Undibacterium terreum]|uniref:PEP-CTERM protein-sorting domain-containing protein n=1 Tax=Undibacterium terreum TaxID=1224302 RepID=A0A916UXI0_9BURK|nr:DUF642 domain-containing protein [Undibacterium terreum]GGC91591.1 hypothetical protein GCM10011396_43600 [Undibacterium terreum]
MKTFKLLALTALVCASAASSAANIVTNGGFEANKFDGSWTTMSSITGWTSTGAFEVQKGSNSGGLNVFDVAYEGVQYLELNSDGLTTVSQSLHTTAGGLYDLSFVFSGRSDTPSGAASSMEVFWGNLDLGKITAAANSGWVAYDFSNLQALSDNTTLSFKSLGPTSASSYGSYLDAVSVNSLGKSAAASTVPEPATLASMSLGLGMLAFASRRRKTAKSSGK